MRYIELQDPNSSSAAVIILSYSEFKGVTFILSANFSSLIVILFSLKRSRSISIINLGFP